MNKSALLPVMSVYVIGSSRHLKEDMPFYRKIADVIYKRGHSLMRNWFEPAYRTNVDLAKNASIDWHEVLEDNLEDIARADIVIIEGTWHGFSDGFFTMSALAQKKPVLFLVRADSAKDRIASGITDEQFVLKTYKTEHDLEKIVDRFIQDNVITSRDLRFNFFLDREIFNHLRWASFKTGKTKAQIIRELIDREITKDDY